MIKFSKSLIICLSMSLAFAANQSLAQDAVYVNKVGGGTSRITGKISDVNPEGVTIDGRRIAASEIGRIAVGKEPSIINRLREEMVGGQYAECLAGIEKLNSVPDEPLLQQEIAFMKAYSSARLSLTQGTITAEVAGRVVGDFIKNAPNSLHLYPAIEQYGRLIYAVGKPELAAKEFEKLRVAKWEDYRMRGQFLHGRMMSVLGQNDKAKADFSQILKQSSASRESDKYKLLARCEQARLNGITGDAAGSLKELDSLIKSESDDNAELFAHIYNAKGAIYEKGGDLKSARDAYLHTQLLFGNVEDPAAEALSRLAKIFVELKDSKRASDSKRELRSKYRNSYWVRQ
ncbi:hypothetical protein N9Y42_08245 [Mariniblastus sp.]|nr:hypothetical protein [Mariniblastus sp.]